MVDRVFDWCVLSLVVLAEQLGMTYQAINVWIFVIIWPMFTLVLLSVVIRQRFIIRKLVGQ